MYNVLRGKKQKGFTLLEAVVSAAVFAFVITAILGVYMAVLRLNARTRAIRSVTENSRFITEFLSKEVRNGRIDYSQTNNLTTLAIINQNNESERIFLSDTIENCKSGTVCNLMLYKPSVSATATPLNSSTVRITNLGFYVSPTGDPFTTAKTFNEQPHVTLIIEFTSRVGTKDAVKMSLQTSFTELYYPSRQ
jgi:type II secretory pathway pseudopilin PulG